MCSKLKSKYCSFVLKHDCPRKHNTFIFLTETERPAVEVHVDILASIVVA